MSIWQWIMISVGNRQWGDMPLTELMGAHLNDPNKRYFTYINDIYEYIIP